MLKKVFSTFSSSNHKEKYKEWKYSVCHENYPFEEINDSNQFEARFLDGTIEWE
tara:strand:+ start:391 stop:552 length:162 start_codon:yes stop_codon:yes gene_type:complete